MEGQTLENKNKENPEMPAVAPEKKKFDFRTASKREVMETMFSEKADFPENVRKNIEKYKTKEVLSPDEMSDLDGVFNEWWESKFGMKFEHRRYDFSLEEIARLPGRAKLKKKALRALNGFDDANLAEISNLSCTEADEASIISKQELQDSKMTTEKRGWARYWLRRLTPELRILPEKIQNVVEKYNESGERKDILKFNQVEALRKYVDIRTKGKQFEFKKRGVMTELKSDLKALDEIGNGSFERDLERRRIFYDGNIGAFFTESSDGEKQYLSFGDIFGDYSWGVKYIPDESLRPAIWRKIRKSLGIYEARAKIETIFNEELVKVYKASGMPTTTYSIDLINARLKESKQWQNEIGGVLAERTMIAFLTRAQYNNGELGFAVERANAFEDEKLKYDFKIILRKRRGIALESQDMPREEFVENKKRIGHQMTISETAGGKRKQINKALKKLDKIPKHLVKRKVDDIKLLKIPELKNFHNLYERWLEEGKPSGGPERYMSREEKLKIFQKAIDGLLKLSPEEFDKLKI